MKMPELCERKTEKIVCLNCIKRNLYGDFMQLDVEENISIDSGTGQFDFEPQAFIFFLLIKFVEGSATIV